MILIMSTYWI